VQLMINTKWRAAAGGPDMASKLAIKDERVPTEDQRVMEADVLSTGSSDYWEELCTWLRKELKGISTSVERREGKCSRLESHFHPLEDFATRITPNGVRTLAITVRTNGHTRTFEVAGPDSVTAKRNAAGRLTSVEIRNAEGALVLHFCGPVPVSRPFTANSWGE
jgi:hypothetical protein